MACGLNREWVSGNIFIRPFTYEKGAVTEGHTHNFDHTTIVFTGSVRVDATLEDGRTITREFTAPAFFLVKAKVFHRIEALEDNTTIWCVYSHRTPQGDVVQEFTGFEAAYN